MPIPVFITAFTIPSCLKSPGYSDTFVNQEPQSNLQTVISSSGNCTAFSGEVIFTSQTLQLEKIKLRKGLDSDGSMSRSLPLSLLKLAESNKLSFVSLGFVSLQISSHEDRSKTKYPWRDGVDLFLQWLLFHAAIWKCKIRVSITQRLWGTL